MGLIELVDDGVSCGADIPGEGVIGHGVYRGGGGRVWSHCCGGEQDGAGRDGREDGEVGVVDLHVWLQHGRGLLQDREA